MLDDVEGIPNDPMFAGNTSGVGLRSSDAGGRAMSALGVSTLLGVGGNCGDGGVWGAKEFRGRIIESRFVGEGAPGGLTRADGRGLEGTLAGLLDRGDCGIVRKELDLPSALPTAAGGLVDRVAPFPYGQQRGSGTNLCRGDASHSR